MSRRTLRGACPIALLLSLAPIEPARAAEGITYLDVPERASATPFVAARGNLVAVVWGARAAGGATDVYLAVSADGGRSFGNPVRVNHEPGEARLGGDLPPRAAFLDGASANTPAIDVLWTARQGEHTTVKIARSADGGRTFSAPRELQAPGAAGDRGWPALAVDRSGRSHAIWLDHRGLAAGGDAPHHGHDGVAMAQRSALYYAPGAGAPTEREVAKGVCYCCKTALAATTGGTLIAAWRHVYPGNLRDIAYAVSPDGGRTFTAPRRVSEDGWRLEGCPDDGPAIAAGPDESVHLVWPTLVGDADPHKAVFYARARNGRFGPRVRVSGAGENAAHPQIAAAANGSVAVLWDRIVEGRRRVFISWKAGGDAGGFGAPAAISEAASASYPAAAFSDDVLVAVWTEGDPSASRIAVLRMPAAASGEAAALRYTDEVTVTAAREERPLASVPSSVGVISGTVLEQAPGVNLSEALKYVPGVAAGNVSGVDDLRISIRGAGIRAGFGSRGVLLMADGFPVTEPDGQTPHVDGQIDLSNAERVEVVKGPASAMYGGAALGGVVNVITRAPSREMRGMLQGQGGGFGFAKAHAGASGGAGPIVLGGTMGYTQVDGFRQHNSLRNWAGTLRADWAGSASRVTLSMLGTDAELELPGTLDRAQFEADPSQSRPVHVVNDWGRDNLLFRVGGRYERQLAPGQMIEADSYAQVRDLFHPIFVVIDQDAARYVGHARYRWAAGVHALAFGLDADTQWTDDRWFVNAGGRPGVQLRDDDDTVTNLGVYVQDEIVLGGRATLTLGVRGDSIVYELEDRRPGDGDATDRRTFRRLSPKVGVTAAVTPDIVIYGNVSTGFEAPTLGEVRLPAGFNGAVRPQRAVSLEAGVRGGGRLSWDAAVYHMRVTDEILPETVDTVTVYRNVAEADHTGVELSSRLRAARWLTVDASYAWSRFVLAEFGAFTGNRLPGIPAHTGTLRAAVAGVGPWDASASLVAAGPTWVNDANTEAAGGYAVLSAGAGYRIGPVRLFARGENVGDARYTNRVQVNDSGGFFYYPAPGRHASAGAEVRW